MLTPYHIILRPAPYDNSCLNSVVYLKIESAYYEIVT